MKQACAHTWVHMHTEGAHKRTAQGHRVTGEDAGSNCVPRSLLHVIIPQSKGEPHGGAAGRGRRDAGHTLGTGFTVPPLTLSPQWVRNSATETPQASKGRAVYPLPHPLPAHPKASYSGSNYWA